MPGTCLYWPRLLSRVKGAPGCGCLGTVPVMHTACLPAPPKAPDTCHGQKGGWAFHGESWDRAGVWGGAQTPPA